MTIDMKGQFFSLYLICFYMKVSETFTPNTYQLLLFIFSKPLVASADTAS